MVNPNFAESADGTSIAYTSSVDSSGPGLVLLSGSALAPTQYSGLARRLSRSFSVHVVHRRGRGASGPQGENYALAREVDDVIAVLERTGSRLLFGHSFGGLLALHTGLSAPGHLDVIVTYEPAIAVNADVAVRFLPHFAAALEAGRPALAMAILLRGIGIVKGLDQIPLPLVRTMSALMLAGPFRMVRPVLPTVVAEARAAMTSNGSIRGFAALRTDTLMMMGERGPSWIQEGLDAIATVSPAARVMTMPGLDHQAPLYRPAKIAATTAGFLTGVKPR